MDYVLGIDSGGTKFLVKAVSLEGIELAEYEGHPRDYTVFPEMKQEKLYRRIWTGVLDRRNLNGRNAGRLSAVLQG